MAEFVLPPEMEAFAEAAGDAAMGPFQAADFNADPSAAFSEGMGAAMDFMSDAGMPPDMMNMIQDICQGGFDAHMAANPDSSPMDAFDAVGGAVDMYLADFPADMPCMEMMDAGMPPMPPDMGEFMDTCPPYGDFPGGDNFDAANMPDSWEPGPMTGDMNTFADAPDTSDPLAGDSGIPDPATLDTGDPLAGGPDGPGFDMPEGTTDGPPPGDMAGNPNEGMMGPDNPQPGFDMPEGTTDGPPPGDMAGDPAIDPATGMAPQPPEGPGEGGYDDGPAPMDYPPDGPPPGEPGGPDPLFGEGGPAGGPPPGEPGGPPPGDPMGPPPGMDMDGDGMPPPPPDGMGDMHTHMDDAGAHQGPEGPPPGDPGPMPGDMPADMPPPPDDPNDGGEVV